MILAQQLGKDRKVNHINVFVFPNRFLDLNYSTCKTVSDKVNDNVGN